MSEIHFTMLKNRIPLNFDEISSTANDSTMVFGLNDSIFQVDETVLDSDSV